MKFGKSDIHEEYFAFLAQGLRNAAALQPDPQLALDNLMGDLSFAFLRRLGGGYTVEGETRQSLKVTEMFGVDEELQLDTRWIPATIETLQRTWKTTHEGPLPVDFIEGNSNPDVDPLMKALGKIERDEYMRRHG